MLENLLLFIIIKKKTIMEKNHRLFLRNLSKNVTNNEINEVFKNYGDITNIEIKEKADANFGNVNKFAFVNITTSERKLNTCK